MEKRLQNSWMPQMRVAPKAFFTEVEEHVFHTYSVTLTPIHLPRPELTCYFPSMLTLDITVSCAKSHFGERSLLNDNANYITNLFSLLPQRFQHLTQLSHNSL